MKKTIKKIASLLLAIIMLMTVIDPTASYAATKSPLKKITRQDTRNGWKYGSTMEMQFWGNFYYRITVDFAKSTKKTKLKLKYSHQIRPSKPGAIKLTVGKKTVKLCKLVSYPYDKEGYSIRTTNLYLESVEIKTGKKWKKVKVNNDGVKVNNVYSEMKTYTLKKKSLVGRKCGSILTRASAYLVPAPVNSSSSRVLVLHSVRIPPSH